MKKLSNKGFVLAETLIVTIFVLTIFTMIYTNYYPIIGVYEERETYDDVEGKYTAYWVKKLVENEGYDIGNFEHPSYTKNKLMMNNLGYVRFECKDMSSDNNKNKMCANLLNALEISNCDINGNGCDIFITHYKIGSPANIRISPNFKKTVNGEIPTVEKTNTELTDYIQKNVKHYEEYAYSIGEESHLCAFTTDESIKNNCKQRAFSDCTSGKGHSNIKLELDGTSFTTESGDNLNADQKEVAEYCLNKITSNVFPSYLVDYINYLPDYPLNNNSTKAAFRVIVVAHHKKALNNFYSFSTMEVSK